jgi:double-strand break repair protein MRE11
MSGSEEEENMDASMMNNHDDDDDEPQDPNRPPTLDPPDADTIRIIVSTDNHLGYNERDAVRGLDSFAALEEVLFLAKELQADMVLLAGDLFHDNKPSRRTLHKTMQLLRTYCMGPNPVQIQILNNNDNSNDTSASSGSVFRQGHVNYEDEHYSVDLPIFAIHGNHDDPTREGGTGNELLAALDLLDAANLVNYIGRQEQVNQISIEPVLIKKGISHLALYGMGSMRDERLNRMWQSQKVQFARPEVNDNDNDEEQPQAWFNLFALHQNRDLGRGTKNCVHESMIPEWMDLVVWGHEHECCIEPQESVVGTFRITQPGSSVATSLSVGESSIKKIGVLDIRGSHFRLLPIPLTQVRSFVLGEFRLTDQSSLDPEDPKVEPKITSLLEDQVRLLVYNAREKTKEIWQAAKDAGNLVARANTMPLSMALEKPAEVLVRIKVDHSGFSTLNNQRFGAKFIGQVANPVSILYRIYRVYRVSYRMMKELCLEMCPSLLILLL